MPGITIHDVARESGVSIATVSYVLNGSRRVAEQTRERVLNSVQRLGYRPNVTARNLQASETRLIGYSWRPISPDQFNPILDKFLQAIAEAAALRGYRVLAFPSLSMGEEHAIYAEMILTHQVDGFILSNTNFNDERIKTLIDAGFPFVSFGRANPEWDFHWVDVDGFAGMQSATNHLIESGHRRIAFLAWNEGSLSGHYRLEGYLSAMHDAGLDLVPAWIQLAENSHASAYKAAQRLLGLPLERRPSAVIASSDLMAMGIINASWDAGLKVGRDLAVIGYDDAPIARFLRPPLSTLSQPLSEVGELLVSMLIDVVRKQSTVDKQVLLSPTLVVRDSSAVPYLPR